MTTQFDKTSVLAFLSSVSSAAAMSAFISYDYDISTERRMKDKFYGYIPLNRKSKVKCMIALFSISFFNYTCRAMSVVLMYMLGGKLVAIGVLIAEFFLYLMVKTWR